MCDPDLLVRFDLEWVRKAQNFQPWLERSPETDAEQNAFQRVLANRAGAVSIGDKAFISPDAHIFTTHLIVGRNSWIAAGAIVRGHVNIGSDSSINSFAHIAGLVSVGDGVRIAGMVSVYGFNHGYSRHDIPIYQQQHTADGVTIEDGCWVGANSVIVDGVTIGRHSIVGAGSVVTKNVPEFSIVVGNPARVIKSRRP